MLEPIGREGTASETPAADPLHPDPPAVFVAAMAMLFILAVFAPSWPAVPGWLRAAGVVPILTGITVHTWAWATFRIAGTTVRADEPPTRLVRSGPYSHTRNPMYLAGVLILSGFALLVGSAAVLVAPAAYAIVAHTVFLPEEARRMEEAFGAKYEAYRRSVPAWL